MALSFLPRRRFWLITLLAFCCVFLFQSGACADPGELATIQKAIKEKKAHWVAGETSVSELSPDAKRKRVGTLKPIVTKDEEKAAAEEQAALATLAAPGSYDWRQTGDTSGGNYVSLVRNQGSCGSCWAFAATAALESQVLLSNQGSRDTLNLAEQILVSCSPAGNCNGGYVGAASDYIRDFGLPADTCFPYSATNDTCASACPDWTHNSYRIASWYYVATTSPTVDSIKTALYTYGPLVTTMAVYNDFYSYTSGVYSHVTGSYLGGHAILIVGYDDVGKYFIAKNSWGTGWGIGGFFNIAYSELNSVVNFGDYTIAYVGHPIDPPAPPACTYSISPTAKTFKAGGGTGSITVSTQSPCAWTAAENIDWVTVTSGFSGSTSGMVKYTVAANPTTVTRTGTITIGGQSFKVTQQPGRATRTR